MDKKPILLVFVMLFSFLLAMGIAARFGGPSTSKQGASQAPAKKFRAQPGTMRKNARALVSSVPSAPSNVKRDSSVERRNIEVWGRLDSPEKVKTLAERLADEALGKASAEEGIAMLERFIQDSSNVSSSETYLALAVLHSRNTPPDVKRMEEAFDYALRLASTDGERVHVFLRHAQTLHFSGQHSAALKVVTRASVGDAELSAEVLELDVLRGSVLEGLGEVSLAKSAYEDAMKRVVEFGVGSRDATSTTYRQAALRLARLYRADGETREEARVRREVKAWFSEERGY